ncbi:MULTISPECIES: glycoside hydrolase family 19 protein [Massilia]|nr:glycoside hydrolase family 19 protein [Massilia aquatica]NHZ41815.1 glycoside hydrolase family 19 protein [Massilia aquatica]
MTLEELRSIMPFARAKAGMFLPGLNAAMAEFDIDTPVRQAAFLAQVGHESGHLRYVRELASGAAYEGRRDLGNVVAGDGVRFRGRGLIQLTGRSNYSACGKALGMDLIAHPELLEQPANACRSAGWFWHANGLNALADAREFVKLTRRINGGANGLVERLALTARALKVLA